MVHNHSLHRIPTKKNICFFLHYPVSLESHFDSPMTKLDIFWEGMKKMAQQGAQHIRHFFTTRQTFRGASKGSMVAAHGTSLEKFAQWF